MNIETKEPAPSADKIERKVFTDPETGIEQIELEKNGETSEIFLRAPDGKMLSYINLEKISALADTERDLELMGVEISPSIIDLIDKDRTKYYIRFLEKGRGN